MGKIPHLVGKTKKEHFPLSSVSLPPPAPRVSSFSRQSCRQLENRPTSFLPPFLLSPRFTSPPPSHRRTLKTPSTGKKRRRRSQCQFKFASPSSLSRSRNKTEVGAKERKRSGKSKSRKKNGSSHSLDHGARTQELSFRSLVCIGARSGRSRKGRIEGPQRGRAKIRARTFGWGSTLSGSFLLFLA